MNQNDLELFKSMATDLGRLKQKVANLEALEISHFARLVGGRIVGTTPLSCRVTHSVAQSITSGVGTSLAFDTEIFDNGSLHDTSTNNDRITVTEAGVYIITASVNWAANASGRRQLSISVNGTGSPLVGVNHFATSGSVGSLQTVTTIYQASISDFFVVRALQDSGSALNIDQTNYYSPIFAIAKIA